MSKDIFYVMDILEPFDTEARYMAFYSRNNSFFT